MAPAYLSRIISHDSTKMDPVSNHSSLLTTFHLDVLFLSSLPVFFVCPFPWLNVVTLSVHLPSPSAPQPHPYSHWDVATVDTKAAQGREWVQYCQSVIVVFFKLGKTVLSNGRISASIWHEELEGFFLVPTTFGHLQPLYLLPVFFLFFFSFSLCLPFFPSSLPHFHIPPFLSCFGPSHVGKD